MQIFTKKVSYLLDLQAKKIVKLSIISSLQNKWVCYKPNVKPLRTKTTEFCHFLYANFTEIKLLLET